MTQGPEQPNPYDPNAAQPPSGDPYAQQVPYDQQYQQPYGQQYQQPYGQYGQYGQPAAQPGVYGVTPMTPYGVHPVTGIPYSDKQKLVAGLLQILIPLGIGRFYTGHTGLGVGQLVVTILTCGIGALWPFIDGIVMLASGDSTDAEGRLLR